jgi:hypothetical protein
MPFAGAAKRFPQRCSYGVCILQACLPASPENGQGGFDSSLPPLTLSRTRLKGEIMSTNCEEPKNNNHVKFVRAQNAWPITWTAKIPAKIHSYATELRRRIASKKLTGTADDFLAEPLQDCETGDTPRINLINWIYFNPFGPTLELLCYIPIPGSRDGLIAFHSDNPFARQRIAFGLVPGEDDWNHVEQAALALFMANGHESSPLFSGSLPTSVFHAGNWQAKTIPPSFDSKFSRALFKLAAADAWPGDMRSVCGHLRRYKDPWERTFAEFQSSVRGAMNRADVGQSKFDESQFDEWFELVTDHSHVERERLNLDAAWEGAIRYQLEREANAN